MPAVTEQFVTEFVVEGLGAFKQAMRDADSAMSGLDARGRATGGGLGGFFDGVLGHMQTIGKATLAAAAAVETFSILERIDVGETVRRAWTGYRGAPFSILERLDVGET